ncbi:hypothetical protein QL285_092108 [Trifolium repens]|nr:hypothetical protein QL285_092108 [Trifolium repens]
MCREKIVFSQLWISSSQGTFDGYAIAYAKYDAQPIKSEPVCQKLGVKTMYMDQTLKLNGEFGGTSAFIELPREDIINLCMGTKELGITILQVWLFHHWQLLIINRTKLEVVFLCSLENRPDKKIYEILDTVLAAHNKLQRAKKQKKVDWLFPTSQKLVMSAAISS